MDELLLWDSGVNADDNSYPPTSGSDVQSQLARMKARLVARYRLAAVPGRPEELIRPWSSQAVSLGYGCKTIRVRTMVGREWIDHRDFQIREGWQIELDELGDKHFGAPNPTPAVMGRKSE